MFSCWSIRTYNYRRTAMSYNWLADWQRGAGRGALPTSTKSYEDLSPSISVYFSVSTVCCFKSVYILSHSGIAYFQYELMRGNEADQRISPGTLEKCRRNNAWDNQPHASQNSKVLEPSVEFKYQVNFERTPGESRLRSFCWHLSITLQHVISRQLIKHCHIQTFILCSAAGNTRPQVKISADNINKTKKYMVTNLRRKNLPLLNITLQG